MISRNACENFLLCVSVGFVVLLRPLKFLYPLFWKSVLVDVQHGVAYCGRINFARLLIWFGADVNARERMIGARPLFAAAKSGKIKMLQYLLAHGADVNAQDDGGNTALMRAVNAGHITATELLLDNGADANAATQIGQTVFMGAALRGDLAIMQMLLDHGADATTASLAGINALVWSVPSGRPNTLRFLIDHGVRAEGRMGQMALDLAKHYRRYSLIPLLHEAGATE